eukprot:14851180-Ditylum_brightwellii.AAC.1
MHTNNQAENKVSKTNNTGKASSMEDVIGGENSKDDKTMEERDDDSKITTITGNAINNKLKAATISSPYLHDRSNYYGY